MYLLRNGMVVAPEELVARDGSAAVIADLQCNCWMTARRAHSQYIKNPQKCDLDYLYI